jgi:hypothetical protein
VRTGHFSTSSETQTAHAWRPTRARPSYRFAGGYTSGRRGGDSAVTSRDLRCPAWIVTSSRLAYVAPDMAVFADQVIRRHDGHLTVNHRLVEPESVRVVAIDTAGELALVWRWRAATGAVTLELPSAAVRPEEDGPLETAQRALRADSGLVAGTWTALGNAVIATGAAAQTVHLLQAHDLHRAARPPGDGSSHPTSLPYPVVVSGGSDGPVVDAASLAALFGAERHRTAGDWQLPAPTVPPPTGSRLWPPDREPSRSGRRHRHSRRPDSRR